MEITRVWRTSFGASEIRYEKNPEESQQYLSRTRVLGDDVAETFNHGGCKSRIGEESLG